MNTENKALDVKKGDLYLCNLYGRFSELEVMEVCSSARAVKTDRLGWINEDFLSKKIAGKIGTVKYFGWWIFKGRKVVID